MAAEGGETGRFLNLQRVGVGTFGTVFKAKEQHTGERVAIKVIERRMGSSYATKRVLRELTILRLCRHPSIINVMEIISKDDVPQLRLVHGDGALCLCGQPPPACPSPSLPLSLLTLDLSPLTRHPHPLPQLPSLARAPLSGLLHGTAAD